MNSMKRRLIVFTRYPEPGQTKTRLIPALGTEGAAELQRQMTEYILAQALQFAAPRGVGIDVYYCGGSRQQMRDWLGRDIGLKAQATGELDQRMGQAFTEAFAAGADEVVIIGTDIPGLGPCILANAFDALVDKDLVFGPAFDGGYYLIGANRAGYTRVGSALFAAIEWGSATVLQKTLKIASEHQTAFTLLEKLRDVDRIEDIPVWEAVSGKSSARRRADRISVIIPALNESGQIAATLSSVRQATDVELIVVDGGSTDDTPKIAAEQGATVLSCQPSRAAQMNAGARVASGGLLLFLHADTLLPSGYDTLVRHAILQNGAAGGAFKLAIDAPGLSLRIMERVAHWRSIFLKLPYGDQAIFLSASLFESLGGFPQMPIMEDYALVRRLKRHGRIAILPQPVVTSARRWLAFGAWRTWLINQAVIFAYYLGVSSERLAAFYRRGGNLHR